MPEFPPERAVRLVPRIFATRRSPCFQVLLCMVDQWEGDQEDCNKGNLTDRQSIRHRCEVRTPSPDQGSGGGFGSSGDSTLVGSLAFNAE